MAIGNCGVQIVDFDQRILATRHFFWGTDMENGTLNYADRVAELRALFRKNRIDAYMVPRQDQFQGEYVPANAERLQWLSGFAGSWGIAIVASKTAAIFVDGRYTVQVREQVDTKLFVPHDLVDSPPSGWIKANLKKGMRLGFDPWLTTMADAAKLAEACGQVGAKIAPLTVNLVDAIWSDRPEETTDPISSHLVKYAGVSVDAKMQQLSKSLIEAGADTTILCEPSSTSWLFNIRGKDVPHTPVVAAFSIVKKKGKANLFVATPKVPDGVRAQLESVAEFRQPRELEKQLTRLGKATVLLDPATTAEKVRDVLAKAGARIVIGTDPCSLPRAQKNQVELEGAVKAHIRDGAAMVKFLQWFDTEGPNEPRTEVALAEKLLSFRKQASELMDLSFTTISAAGPNAAIPHYSVKNETQRTLEADQVYLVDSGAQYRDGTTDITRTVFNGTPSREFKQRFTAVLKGMIQVSLLRFPEGTTGSQLDAHARAALWKMGLDYNHGTGHGIGSYLSVHEGPQRINKSTAVKLQPGMIISNEPGYYKVGAYGIRIENLLLVTKPQAIPEGDRDMLGFETLTLCPIDRRLVETNMLTREELTWLDTYHATVWRTLRPLVEGPTANWLTKACAPIK